MCEHTHLSLKTYCRYKNIKSSSTYLCIKKYVYFSIHLQKEAQIKYYIIKKKLYLVNTYMLFSVVNECSTNNGGCSQKCVDDVIGFHCDCFTGYKLLDNQTCEGMEVCLYDI